MQHGKRVGKHLNYFINNVRIRDKEGEGGAGGERKKEGERGKGERAEDTTDELHEYFWGTTSLILYVNIYFNTQCMSNMYISFALHLLNLEKILKSANIFQNSSCLNKNVILRNFELRGKKDRSPTLNHMAIDEAHIESGHSQMFGTVIFISYNHCHDFL